MTAMRLVLYIVLHCIIMNNTTISFEYHAKVFATFYVNTPGLSPGAIMNSVNPMRVSPILTMCFLALILSACAPAGVTLYAALGNASSAPTASFGRSTGATSQPTPIPVSSVSAIETFESSGYPPATFAVETRMPIPEVMPRATPMAGKTEHVERTLTALGQQITIKADVVMPPKGPLKRYQASLRKQTSEQLLSKQKDFFFGAGMELIPADPAYLKRFYQSNTVYLLSPDNRQELLLVNQGVGDVYSVAFYNNGPWNYHINTEDAALMQSQAFSILNQMFPDEVISPVPYRILGPGGEDTLPFIRITYAQILDGLPIACDLPADLGISIPRPSLDVLVTKEQYQQSNFYSIALFPGDIVSISAHYLYDVQQNEKVESVNVIPLSKLLDIMQEKNTFLTMITPEINHPVFDMVRLVYDVDTMAQTDIQAPFVLKPYWEFARYSGNSLLTYRYDADPAAYR